MVFDGFVWNTRPGACEEEPPVANSGPWSTTVTSVQPRSVSSSASALPTTPAPMMTTRGDLVMSTHSVATARVAPYDARCAQHNTRASADVAHPLAHLVGGLDHALGDAGE